MADKQVSTSQFRVTYTHLTDPVVVTALGRPIGRWVPYGWEAPAVVEEQVPTRGATTTRSPIAQVVGDLPSLADRSKK